MCSGNVVSPGELADRVTEEGLRYFLLREGVPHTVCFALSEDHLSPNSDLRMEIFLRNL